MRQVEEAIIFNGGEVVPGSVLESAFEQAAAGLMVKIDHLAEYVEVTLEGEAAALEAASKRLASKAKAVRNHQERLLGYAGKCLGERTELKGEAWSIKRVKNPPSAVVIDIGAVHTSCPQAFKREALEGLYEIEGEQVFTLKLDKAALKDALKSSSHIRGAELVQGTRIEVK